MSIKSIKKVRTFGYRQTQFIPQHKEKYVGSWPIQCRSSWEVKFCQKCDLEPSIISWTSESFVVPYIDPTKKNTQHKYYVDFTITIKNQFGKLEKFAIEIKPKKETIPPCKEKFRSNDKYKLACETYIRNQCKWKAASEAAKKYGMEFRILTETELRIKK